MSAPLTKRSIDHSNTESFSFSFFCDQCGKEWASLTVGFASGGFTVIENEAAWKLIWAEEHRLAFEKANLEAHLHFNWCSEIGEWICDDCFEIRDGMREVGKNAADGNRNGY